MNKKNILTGIGLGVVLIALIVYTYAKVNHIKPLGMVDRDAFNTYAGVALKGYDPISYFTGVPRKGEEQYQTEWAGAKWYFTSKKNMNAFRINPEKFAPQFGGYCSFAVTTGYTATIDPQSYMIQDDKLYFFNGPDVRMSFMIETEQSIKTATENWIK